MGPHRGQGGAVPVLWPRMWGPPGAGLAGVWVLGTRAA